MISLINHHPINLIILLIRAPSPTEPLSSTTSRIRRIQKLRMRMRKRRMRMRRMRMIGSCSGLIFFIWPLWGEGRYWEWMTLLAISNLVYHIINHDYFMVGWVCREDVRCSGGELQ